MHRSNLLALSLLAALSCAGPRRTPPPPAPAAPADVPGGINDEFLSPDLDVAHFAQVFEGESREVARQRDAIVRAMELRPGQSVADVGAGTGLFLEPFAAAVGPEGRVFEVDLSPRFLDFLRARVGKLGLRNAEVVACTDRSTELPEGSVDVVFVCDTYHHFEHPADTLASIHRALRPGGALVVVDFERIPGTSRDWVLQHVRAGEDTVTAEIESAGFALDRDLDAGLEENWARRFRRP